MLVRAPGAALELVDHPDPIGDVVVDVAACAACHRDLLDRQGAYRFTRWPIITGHEWAGVVATSNLSEWKPGDRVASTHRPSCGDCEWCLAGDEAACRGS